MSKKLEQGQRVDIIDAALAASRQQAIMGMIERGLARTASTKPHA